ncbi:putative T7SS-secreted protein [Amycolatopsis sp. NPDC005232]|uniref:putative T7SS-secreted protein n=1 Tax=Amycolatopsis sp. NPDC005232 TaxID=3157027 RepID=UPI0033AE6CC0
MAAELGDTTDPKDLVPGEPRFISGDLKDLVRNIQKMAAISDGLSGVDAKQWSGEASDRFRETFGREPKKWFDTIGVLGTGANALADYGDALTRSQSEAQRAIELYTQGQAATRAASSQWIVDAYQALTGGYSVPAFADPGQGATRQAEQILRAARAALEEAGGSTAEKLGFEKKADGTYKKDLGDSHEFGAEHRDKETKTEWDPDKKKWVKVEEDPGGWQDHKGGKNYSREFGSQSDGMLTDKLGGLLEKFGIDTSESTVSASASVDLVDGSLEGKFGDGTFGGSGKIEGAALGAGAEAHAGAGPLGLTAGASAEAYLAKGSAQGEVHYGDHVAVKGDASAEVGAKASAQGSLGWSGMQGSVEGFAGGRIEGNASAEVAGVTAGAHGEAWAGVGAEASAQFGMGDDGKFHVGASLGVALGIGGKVGFDLSIDPGEVVDTVQDVAGDVADVASDVGHGIANAAGAVGDFLGF